MHHEHAHPRFPVPCNLGPRTMSMQEVKAGLKDSRLNVSSLNTGRSTSSAAAKAHSLVCCCKACSSGALTGALIHLRGVRPQS